jgi:hypothetical protein
MMKRGVFILYSHSLIRLAVTNQILYVVLDHVEVSIWERWLQVDIPYVLAFSAICMIRYQRRIICNRFNYIR